MDCTFIVFAFLLLGNFISQEIPFTLESFVLVSGGKCECEWQWQCHDEFGSDKCRTPSVNLVPCGKSQKVFGLFMRR